MLKSVKLSDWFSTIAATVQLAQKSAMTLNSLCFELYWQEIARFGFHDPMILFFPFSPNSGLRE